MVLPRSEAGRSSGGGAKYFPTDDGSDSEMAALIDGLDAPSTSRPGTLPVNSIPGTSSGSATFTRSSGFEEQYTTLGEPSTSAHQNNFERQETEIDHVALAVHRQQSFSSYYNSVEQEENIKCVVSTVIFFSIVLIVLVLAFTINPQMA